MKLLRTNGLGKYRVWDNRKQCWVVDDGPGEQNEHFVLMLKDRFAGAALEAYAAVAEAAGEFEYAQDVRELAARSGVYHPNCKYPD